MPPGSRLTSKELLHHFLVGGSNGKLKTPPFYSRLARIMMCGLMAAEKYKSPVQPVMATKMVHEQIVGNATFKQPPKPSGHKVIADSKFLFLQVARVLERGGSTTHWDRSAKSRNIKSALTCRSSWGNGCCLDYIPIK